MINKAFDQISKEELDSLVSNEVKEGRTLEYKENLPGGTDSEKKEFLADVSSFANAVGGDLLFGVKEKRDANGKTTGIPESVPGLAGINVDFEIRRLENLSFVGAGGGPQLQMEEEGPNLSLLTTPRDQPDKEMLNTVGITVSINGCCTRGQADC